MRRRKLIKRWKNALISLGVCTLGTGLVLVIRKLQRQPPDSVLSRADQDFVRQAAQDELAELALAHLAGQRGQSDAIRQLSQRLLKDHGQVHSELVSLAMARGVVPPGYLPASKRGEVETLARLLPTTFEQRFAQSLISVHKDEVSLFERQSSCGDDPALRDFARRTLPALHTHLRLALDLRNQPPSARPAAS